MNHVFRIVLVLSLPLIAIAALVISSNQANPLPSHEMAAGTYVAYWRSTTFPTLAIKQYTQARLPQNFLATMSKLSYGDTPHNETTQRNNPNYPGQKPLPYPPNELWCVKLSSLDPAAPQVVVVALHQDMYNADWVVHEVTDPKAVLAAVGCQFSVQ